MVTNTIILGILLLLSIIKIILLYSRYNKLILSHKEEIANARRDAVKKSKDVIRGQISEEFVTMFPEFPYNMSDCKFSGSPLDYIVFKGMSSLRDGEEGEIEVVFADVKVNTAQRSKVQNGIKKAIEEGRVRFETWTIDKDKNLKIK